MNMYKKEKKEFKIFDLIKLPKCVCIFQLWRLYLDLEIFNATNPK